MISAIPQQQSTSEQFAGTPETDNDVNQFLRIKLGDDIFGINILSIKEIIEYGHLTPVPMTPDFVTGVLNLRGSVVPIINLAVRFDEKSTEITKRTSIVITEIFADGLNINIGLVVDSVIDVLDIDTVDIQPVPVLGTKIRTDFIGGMAKVNENFLILLDINKVLSIDELSMVVQAKSESKMIEDPVL